MVDRAEDAFDVVITFPARIWVSPAKPGTTGWDPDHIGRAWAELMKRLGYTRYVCARRRLGSGHCRSRWGNRRLQDCALSILIYPPPFRPRMNKALNDGESSTRRNVHGGTCGVRCPQHLSQNRKRSLWNN
jgi:hypothetical protein